MIHSIKNINSLILKKSCLFLLFFFCCFGLINYSSAQSDTKGMNFYFMFNLNDMISTQQLSVFITSDVNTSGVVSISGIAFVQPFVVTANTVTTVLVPNSVAFHTSDVVDQLAVNVTALADVTVYGLNRNQFTTDAFIALPVDIVGTDYLYLNYEDNGRGHLMGIVGTQNATTVTITPTITIGAHPANVPYSITLNAGDSYEIIHVQNGSELTGSKIVSNKPIGVMGANRCANIPNGVCCCDHIVEMLFPTSSWGKNFFGVPLATRLAGDTWRILASENNTTVTIDGVAQPLINSAQFIEITLSNQSIINSDKPVLVAQYSNSQFVDNVVSDPFMMLIIPVEQYLAGYTVTTPASGFSQNFINVVAPNSIVGTLTLDGVPVPAGDFTPIGASGYSGAKLSVALGSHNLAGLLPFGCSVYGFDLFDSYGYPGGGSLSPIAQVTSLVLTPVNGTDDVYNNNCWAAHVTDQNNNPIEGIRVDFNITGPNSASSGFAFTDISGFADFCYTGTNVGTDNIVANAGTVNDAATFVWTNPCDGLNIDDNNACTIDACNSTNGVVTHTDNSPTVNATAGTIDCYGGTTCVTVTATGGNPPYNGTGEFCGYGMGTYTFDVTDAKGCTVISDPVLISEHPKLNVTTTTTASNGADGTATANPTGGTPGYSYLWTHGGQTDQTATGLAPGFYTVVVTDANSCTASATAEVLPACSLAPPGPINGPEGVCKKQSGVVFCVTPNPFATSYIWILPAGVTATGSTTGPCITLKFSSKYKGGFICAQAATPCGVTQAACKNVLLFKKHPDTPGNISGPATLCPNEVATYTIAPVPTADYYEWKEDHLIILSGQGTTVVIVKAEPNYHHGKIKVRSENCKGRSGQKTMNLGLTPGCRISADGSDVKPEIVAENISSLTAYPDPTTGKVTVTFNSNSVTKFSLNVIDMMGKVVISENFTGEEGFNSKDIDLEKYSKGIYLVSIQSEDGNVKSLRLMVE